MTPFELFKKLFDLERDVIDDYQKVILVYRNFLELELRLERRDWNKDNPC